MTGGTCRRPAAVLLAALAMACSGDDGGAASPRVERPALSPTQPQTTGTTEAPLVGEPLLVSEQGLSTFPDPIDPTSSLGGYGVVIDNPNPDLMATGVRVVTRILDASGVELLVDRAVLNAVSPAGRMAVGRTLIEPLADPTQLEVQVEVSAWLRPASATAELTATEIVTEPAPGGGLVTSFDVSSSWPEREEGVDATAVFRAADGSILGAEYTTIAFVAPGASAPVRITLLSPIPGLASTEVFVGRGFAAQTTG